MNQNLTSFTRREFLYSGLGMVSTISTAPGFLSRSSLALADTDMRLQSKPGVPEDRVLVVVQLSGGNDGLNTVVPFGFKEYYRARPALGVPEEQVLKVDLNHGLGLHPSLAPLNELMERDLAAIIQGVGYPNPNRSHLASMDVWHTGDTKGARGHGWIGKALDEAEVYDQSLDCICLGSEAPLAASGKRIKPVTFEQADLFRWTARDSHPSLGKTYDQLQENGQVEPDNDQLSFVFRTAMNTQIASRRIRKAVQKKSLTKFEGTPLSRQLETVAAMIRAELPTRVYYVAQGGFDTHAAQGDIHARLLHNFAAAVNSFYRELEATGHRGRVTTLAFSEFGRRVHQNGSGGTDHGAAGPLFIFGEHLKNSGLLGKHPSLTQLDHGDLIHNVDFRSVYADLLENWMKIDSKVVLGRRFRPTKLLKNT